jgi:hypothetical protein
MTIGSPKAAYDLVMRKAADTRIMLSFFNDVDPGRNESWVPELGWDQQCTSRGQTLKLTP